MAQSVNEKAKEKLLASFNAVKEQFLRDADQLGVRLSWLLVLYQFVVQMLLTAVTSLHESLEEAKEAINKATAKMFADAYTELKGRIEEAERRNATLEGALLDRGMDINKLCNELRKTRERMELLNKRSGWDGAANEKAEYAPVWTHLQAIATNENREAFIRGLNQQIDNQAKTIRILRGEIENIGNRCRTLAKET